MLGHIVLNISNYHHSKKFYEEFLVLIGYEFQREEDHEDCLIGSWKHPEEKLQFMLRQDKKNTASAFVRNVGLDHLCFEVTDQKLVDDLYEKLSVSSATITRTPQKYPEYSESYYAFYFRDPDNIPLEIAYIG